MGACKENINEMQQIIHLFSSSPPPLKMNICIKKLFSQRFYDTSYWYHKSCEGVGGLILEVGTFRKPFFGFSMHTPGLNICFICERTYLQLMIAFVPEH